MLLILGFLNLEFTSLKNVVCIGFSEAAAHIIISSSNDLLLILQHGRRARGTFQPPPESMRDVL